MPGTTKTESLMDVEDLLGVPRPARQPKEMKYRGKLIHIYKHGDFNLVTFKASHHWEEARSHNGRIASKLRTAQECIDIWLDETSWK